MTDPIVTKCRDLWKAYGTVPIWFALPFAKILDRSSILKTRHWATVIPDERSTYVFTDEEAYYKDYAESEFAWTWKKASWDCMRHVEIIGQGCIPVFLNLDLCPDYDLVGYPKALLKDIVQKFIYAGVEEKAQWRF